MLFEKINQGSYQYSNSLITFGCQCTCNHPNQSGGKSSDGASNGQISRTNNNTCSPVTA